MGLGSLLLVGKRSALLVGLAAWSLGTGGAEVLKPLRVLGESGFHHASSLSEIAVLSDGKRILSSSRDGSARLWDLGTGREIRRFLRPDSNDMWGMIVLAGEKEILTAGGSGFVTRWDLATGKQLQTYRQEGTVFRLALRPGGKEFVATDNKNSAVLWNLETGEQLRTFRGHTDSVYTAMFLTEGKRLLTGSSDGKLKLWDVESGECERTYEKDLEDVYTIQSSPDGKRFATCSGDDKLRVFETESLEPVWSSDFEDDLKVVSWSPDGKRVATACEDKFLYVLDAGDGKRLKKIKVPHGYHTPVAFSLDGSELISGGDYKLYRHRIESGKWIVPEAGDPLVQGSVEALALAGAGDRIYAVGNDDVIQVWNPETGEALNRFELKNAARTMEVSPNGAILATGSSGGTVRLRSAQTGNLIREMESEGTVEDVLFAPNGSWLFSAGTDDKVQVWDPATGTRIRTLEGHGNDVNALAVSLDGLTLVTVSDDKTASLWEIETGRLLRTFSGVDEPLRGAVALQDGRSFLVAAATPTLWGWLAPIPKLVADLPRAEIERLVAELAAEKFSRRDAATRALIERGATILPLLEPLKPEHPEAAHRLKRIKSKIRTAEYDGELKALHEFEEGVSTFQGDPGGRYWAAIIGREADSKLVIGEVRNRKLVVLQEYSDGHSPGEVVFNRDGTLLATGNRDGSISVFRVTRASRP